MGIVAHRLELAVNHALKSVNATNHFNIFLSTLHSLFSQSPKNVMELQEAASETHTQMLVITGIFTIRWVASSFQAVRAVWRNHRAFSIANTVERWNGCKTVISLLSF